MLGLLLTPLQVTVSLLPIIDPKATKRLFGYNGSVPFSHINSPFPSASKLTQRDLSFYSRNTRRTEQSISAKLALRHLHSLPGPLNFRYPRPCL